jgi:hypothetical protein
MLEKLSNNLVSSKLTSKQGEFFLRGIVAPRLDHGGRPLYRHGIGIFELLHAWNRRDEICLAGLFHYLYGADSYPGLQVYSQAMVTELLGRDAEQYIRYYSLPTEGSLGLAIELNNSSWLINRNSGEPIDLPSNLLFGDLMTLFLANFVEQFIWWNEEKMVDIMRREWNLEGLTWKKLADSLGEPMKSSFNKDVEAVLPCKPV